LSPHPVLGRAFPALSLQIVVAHIWMLLVRTSSLAPVQVEKSLVALMYASAGETLVRFLILAANRSWREFLYVPCII
jgi:hypothetical protein